jgi:hypothetical protein
MAYPVPRPDGDPEAIADYGRALRRAAARFGEIVASVGADMDGLDLKGPFAERLSERQGNFASNGRRAADELGDLGSRVLAEAGRLRDDIARWESARRRFDAAERLKQQAAP